MDVKKFVSSLSDSEIEELFNALALESKARFKVNNFPPLTEDEEFILHNNGPIKTILAYRARTNQTVRTSKLVIDSYLKGR